jgi:thiamine kinase-like enzyme
MSDVVSCVFRRLTLTHYLTSSSSTHSLTQSPAIGYLFKNMTSKKASSEELQFETINELTPRIFTKLLQRHYHQNGNPPSVVVKSLSSHRVDQGVLSQVYRVTLDYENDNNNNNNNNNNNIPSDWIVKLRRPDLDLGWMFRCEQAFYREVAPRIRKRDSPTQQLPFALCQPLLSSTADDDDNHYLIIENVSDSTCHNLLDGCPPDKVEILLDAMAAWHAACWKSEEIARIPDLSVPPGMGQRLDPLQKEGLFVTQWEDTLEHTMNLKKDADEDEDSLLHQFATTLCKKMADRRLRTIHDKVHDERWTCVHGDWHIANWLFPRDDGKKPVLVDWATCGVGNPMVDLVFFLVVSTNDEVVSDAQESLEIYYKSLLRYNPEASSVGLETMQEWFQWALLCQWMILVAYDNLCRQIVSAEPDEGKRKSQLDHFRNVNRRTLLALQAFKNWDEILADVPPSTDDERKEAEDFCRNTELQI